MTDKYILNPDGSALVLNPDYKGAARFGGVEYFAHHDRIFGSKAHEFEDIGLCMLLLMEDFPDNPKFKIEEFMRRHVEHLGKKSNHVTEALDEIYDLVNKSHYYAAKKMIKRRAEEKCTTELKHEARATQIKK